MAIHASADKDALRRRARAQRMAIPEDEAHHAAYLISGFFFENRLTEKVQSVAGYMPIRNEISPLLLLTALHQRGVVCALPVVRGADEPLIFRQHAPEDELDIGAYGIAHPSADKEEIQPELILVPLLAFDGQGTRLGYGAGHYDRTLYNYRQAGISVIAVGLAFASQQMELLPREPHDMALPYVLTQKGWLDFSQMPDSRLT